MAEEKEKGRATFRCPHAHLGCTNEAVPVTANVCSKCKRRVHLFCEGCGHRYRVGTRTPEDACTQCGFIPTVESLAYVIAPPPEKKRCPTCRTEIPASATRCPKCKRILRTFTRRCPNTDCLEVVSPPTANACKECKEQFKVTVAKTLPYVVCASCGKGDELDDITLRYGIPLIFQTDKGDKVGIFQSVEDAAATWVEFFEPRGSNLTLAEVCASLEESDEEPWEFASAEKAQEFLRVFGFSCTKCWQTAWRPVPTLVGLIRRHGPAAVEIGKGAGKLASKGAKRLLPALVRELVSVGKFLKKKGG